MARAPWRPAGGHQSWRAAANGFTTSTWVYLQPHAGGRGEAAGESLRAFAKSLELAVSTLELDINITKDHQPLVWHDEVIKSQQCAPHPSAEPGAT
jgi:glycerophosphoryl diester phosphodiesterase